MTTETAFLKKANTQHLPDSQLIGHSVDGVACGGAFQPGIGGAIFGMAVGGWLVTRFVAASRTWACYLKKVT